MNREEELSRFTKDSEVGPLYSDNKHSSKQVMVHFNKLLRHGWQVQPCLSMRDMKTSEAVSTCWYLDLHALSGQTCAWETILFSLKEMWNNNWGHTVNVNFHKKSHLCHAAWQTSLYR